VPLHQANFDDLRQILPSTMLHTILGPSRAWYKDKGSPLLPNVESWSGAPDFPICAYDRRIGVPSRLVSSGSKYPQPETATRHSGTRPSTLEVAGCRSQGNHSHISIPIDEGVGKNLLQALLYAMTRILPKRGLPMRRVGSRRCPPCSTATLLLHVHQFPGAAWSAPQYFLRATTICESTHWTKSRPALQQRALLNAKSRWAHFVQHSFVTCPVGRPSSSPSSATIIPQQQLSAVSSTLHPAIHQHHRLPCPPRGSRRRLWTERYLCASTTACPT